MEGIGESRPEQVARKLTSTMNGNSVAETQQDTPAPMSPGGRNEQRAITTSDTSAETYHPGGPGTNLQTWDQRDASPSAPVHQVNIKDSEGIRIGGVTNHYYYPEAPAVHEDPRGSYLRSCEQQIRVKSDRYRTQCIHNTRDLFVETTLYNQAKEAIERENSLLIVGPTGDGKSFILKYISSNHLKDYLPLPCKRVNEIDKYMDLVQGTNIRLLFVFDDPLGTSYTQQLLVDEWEHMCEYLEVYLDENVHKFIFATRKTVWTECRVLKGKAFFSNVVEVSSRNLTSEDKHKMLQKHLKDNTDSLSKKQYDHIVYKVKPLAFGQCCRLMSTAIEKDNLSGDGLIEIFNKPFLHLQLELKKMTIAEKEKYATLSLVLLCGGKIASEELTHSLPDVTCDVRERIKAVLSASGCLNLTCPDLQSIADKLTGTYLELVQESGAGLSMREVYMFSHDSVHEAVTKVHMEQHFGQCLKFLPHDAIVKLARPRTFEKGGHEFVVCVPDESAENYEELARVFTEAAIVGNWGLHDVFRNPFVREKSFQRVWRDYLKSRPEKLTAFIKSKSPLGQCVECLSYLSGAHILWEFVDPNFEKCHCRTVSSLLAEAASLADTEAVKSLIKSHKPTDDQICHAVIISASKHECTDVLKLLLHKLDCDRREETIERSLERACYSGNRVAVKYLLEACYNPCRGIECGCRLALMSASRRGHTDIVEVLLSHGTDINVTDNNRATCLHWAAWGGHNEMVRYLVTHGADVQLTDDDGHTCLRSAVYKGHRETVRYLVSHGSKIDMADNGGRTCLHWAVYMGHSEIVQCLLTEGADVNASDNKDLTCLHKAAYRGYLEIVCQLIARGANESARTKQNSTALDLAGRYGHRQIVEMLAKRTDGENACVTESQSAKNEGCRNTEQLRLANSEGDGNINLEVLYIRDKLERE